MTNEPHSTSTSDPSTPKPLRLWPGVVAAVSLLLCRFGLKRMVDGFEGFSLGMQTALACAAVVLLWWLFFSRAAWLERLGAIALMAGGLYLTWQLKHDSMGPLWLVGYAIPWLMVAFVAWAVLSRGLSARARRASLVATILLASAGWTLARTDGINGDHVADFGWRWAASPEERLVAEGTLPAATPTQDPGIEHDPLASAPWPGFRGPRRDGAVPGAQLAADGSVSPPSELWRRPVGPGWSSFAVDGERFYTQEQRGDDELVSAYDLATGTPVWHHADPIRFFESNAGAGPRGTPAVSGNQVAALGATGQLNVLDRRDGRLLWARNVADDTGNAVPEWGYSSSPLLTETAVVVAAVGQLVAYDRTDGSLRWQAEDGGISYSSPHATTLGGEAQILLQHGDGVVAVDPEDGTLLWQHAWGGFPMTQPELIDDRALLLAASSASGVRRLEVTRGESGWTAEERWTSLKLKPYFNHFVIHEGHAYGFDNRILAAIDLETGERVWKGGRYGHGQLILIPDQDLLLVLSEKGEIVLVRAKPSGHEELARMPAIEGKTWNHPVLVGDLLLVRNAREMAAFRF